MNGHVATSHDEVLSGGLARLTSLCTISGSPKANTDGVTLVSAVIASLFAPPPGVATHAVEADEVLADYPDPNGPGGSSDPPQARIAVAVPVESEEEESEEELEDGSGAVQDSEMAEVAAAGEATCGAAPGSGAVYMAVEVGAPSTLLGSICPSAQSDREKTARN